MKRVDASPYFVSSAAYGISGPRNLSHAATSSAMTAASAMAAHFMTARSPPDFTPRLCYVPERWSGGAAERVRGNLRAALNYFERRLSEPP